MAIKPPYKTSAIIEYGSRVLPFCEEEMRDAYIEDLNRCFREMAESLSEEELVIDLEHLKAVKEYALVLATHLDVLTKSYKDITDDRDRFIKHSFSNFNIRDTKELLDAVGVTTSLGLAEFERHIEQGQTTEEPTNYVPKR